MLVLKEGVYLAGNTFQGGGMGRQRQVYRFFDKLKGLSKTSLRGKWDQGGDRQGWGCGRRGLRRSESEGRGKEKGVDRLEKSGRERNVGGYGGGGREGVTDKRRGSLSSEGNG